MIYADNYLNMQCKKMLTKWDKETSFEEIYFKFKITKKDKF